MANPRVEELSESDPDEMDIETISPPTNNNTTLEPNTSLMNPSSIPSSAFQESNQQSAQNQFNPPNAPPGPKYDRERVRNWTVLYPLYFDSARTRSQGRRIGKDLAVPNPLAREVVEAVARLGLHVAFEPSKCHPRDWANPGRCRVQMVEEGTGRVIRNMGGVEGKHHLYLKVAEYLRANPADASTPLKMRVPGMQPPADTLPEPAIPRGWKMSKILPVHSPAVTGGGVSENLFKDMMQGMGGQEGQREQSPAGKKKEKKKVKG